jgi:4-hydroxyphenylpyruvate dioxygenase
VLQPGTILPEDVLLTRGTGSYHNLKRKNKMADLFDNPMGLMGFEFVEFASPVPGVLETVFAQLGFTKVANHRSRMCTCTARAASTSSSTMSRAARPPTSRRNTARRPAAWLSACAIRTRPTSALELGAQAMDMQTGPMELRLPAIKGIGGAPLYLIDRFEDGARSTTSTSNSSKAWTAIQSATACRSSTT